MELVGDDPTRDFGVILNGGRWFIGKKVRRILADGPIPTSDVPGLYEGRLEPVYELVQVMNVQNGGDIQWMHTCAPVLCFPGITWMEFPLSPWVELSRLPEVTRVALHGAMKRADNMAEQMKRRHSRIAMPT